MSKGDTRIKKTVKKCISILAALCMTVLLCGCGVEIDAEESRSEEGWSFNLTVTMPSEILRKCNDSATEKNPATGLVWTVDSWFAAYFRIVAEIHGLEYRYLGPDTSGTKFGCSLFVPEKSASDEIKEALDVHEDYDIDTNLFLRKINVVRDGRFDWWIREFGAQYENGAPVEGDGAAVMAVFLYGSTVTAGNEEKSELLGFADAFPAAAEYLERYGEAKLHDYWYSSSKLIVNADRKLATLDENGDRDRKVACYYFEQTASDGDRAVEYSYYRADPTGWYIVAIVGGLLAVGIVLLVVRSRRKRATPPPRIEDEFPYDPFADYNAPTSPRPPDDNSDDNNPFAGY